MLNNAMPLRRFILCVVVLLLGCEGGAAPAPAKKASSRTLVVASVYPLADLARVVGGDGVDVKWLAESGDNLENIRLSTEQRNVTQTADMLLLSGGPDGWALDPARQFNADRLLRLDRFSQSPGALWLDPKVGQQTVHELGLRLSTLRKQDSDAIYERAERLSRDIDQLSRSLAVPRQSIRAASTTRTLQPLFDGTGIRVVNVEIDPLNIRDEDLRQLKSVIRAQKVVTLFLPADVPEGVRTYLHAELGVTVRPIDTLGSTGRQGNNTYLQLLGSNLAQLTAAAEDR